MVKLGTQAIKRQKYYTGGKLVQQVGKKPTQAQIASKQIQPQFQTTVSKGYLTQSDVNAALVKAQQELAQIDRDRAKAYEVLKSHYAPHENIGSSQLRNFNRDWDVKREQANRKAFALGNLKRQIGTRAISQQSLNEYVAGSTAGVERDYRRAETFSKQTAEYKGLVETYGTTLTAQEIIKLTPSQLKVAGVTKADVKRAREEIKRSKEIYGTYVSPSGEKMSMLKEHAMKEIETKGGEYYGEDKKYTPAVSTTPFKDYSDILTPSGFASFSKEYGEPVSSPPPFAIEPYKPPTKEELALARETKYTVAPGIIGGYLGKISESKYFKGVKSTFASLTGDKKSYEEQAFSPTSDFEPEYMQKRSIISVPTIDKELSESALFFKKSVQEEIPLQFKVEYDIKRKREEILKEISPGGITQIEATKATKELQTYSEKQWKIYSIESKKRIKKREEEIFEIKYPEEVRVSKGLEKLGIKKLSSFSPTKMRSELFKKYDVGGGFGGGVAGIFAKSATGITMFGRGTYEGIRVHPVKTATSFAAIAGITAVTGGLGTSPTISAYAPTIMKAGKGVQWGLGGIYGTSVGARIMGTSGYFEKWGTAGEIFGTEILPMGVGAKISGYGVRRYAVSKQLKLYTKKLPPEKMVEFKMKLLEAKAYEKIKPPVQEISLKRLKLLEPYPEAQEALIKWFGKKKKLTVGGSIAQQTQLEKGLKLPTKRPSDIDVYFKGLMEERGSIKAAKEAAQILKKWGIKDVKVKEAKVKIGGEKLIEFHPYKTYLRPNIEQVTSWWKPSGAGITKTPSGVKVLKLSVQWKRKLVGGYLEPYATGKHRLKDIPSAENIRKSMMETSRKSTIDIPIKYPSETISGKGSLGTTVMRISPFIFPIKPVSIQVVKTLKPKIKSMVESHELIHAMHPFWTETKVLKHEGVGFGKIPKEIWEGKEPGNIKELLSSTTMRGRVGKIPKKTFEYETYKPTKIPTKIVTPVYKPTKTPTKIITPIYKPTITPTIVPYKPTITPTIVPYKPTKPTKKIVTLPYKPFVPYKPITPIITTHYEFTKPFKPRKGRFEIRIPGLLGAKPKKRKPKKKFRGQVIRKASLWALGEKIYATSKRAGEISGLGLRPIIIKPIKIKSVRKKK